MILDSTVGSFLASGADLVADEFGFFVLEKSILSGFLVGSLTLSASLPAVAEEGGLDAAGLGADLAAGLGSGLEAEALAGFG